ncbi:MAG: sugar transferase [Paludibacteraceae bacterium]|nr:sugar transferase [Paludibacteraceae bacterium]MBR5822942.1 sugar transferase [Paludibacteraceae bacterium]
MNRKRAIFYILFDVVAALLVWLLFYLYRRITNDMVILGGNVEYYFVPDYSLLPSIISFPVVALFIHYLTGFYNTKVRYSRLVELFSTLVGSFFISTIIYFGMLVDDIVVSYTFYYRSFLILWAMFFAVTYLFRVTQTLIVLSHLRKGLIPNNVLIVGTGDTAHKVTDIISNDSSRTGQKIIGYIAVRDRVVIDENMLLGRLNDLEQVVQNHIVNEVIIAVDDMDNDMIFSIANRLIVCGVEVKFAPRLFEVVTGHVSFTNVTAEPLVDITSSRMPAWQQSVKRFFDIASSAIAMIILLPVYLYVAVRVKLGSKGPIFYKQERIGYEGRPFMIYKFRTMYTDAESKGPQLSQVGDPRITPFGHVMRKYRLDELPQFWNIIKGDMSIVGPRPERRYYIEQIERIAPYYCLVYKVRPGLLSWGPIKIGYSDTVEKMVERLRYDIIYMDNMTIQTDIKILYYSIGVILRGKGQ